MRRKPETDRPPPGRANRLVGGVDPSPQRPDRTSLPASCREAGVEADGRLIWVVCGLLVVAVGLVFGQTVTHEFVNWDDPNYVYENAHVRRGMSVEGVVWAFTSRCSANWHPLTWISHMLDCQVYGLWAGGHHLTNVLIHAVTCVGLFLLLRRMTGRLWPSALVAAIFAIHPLRVESVAWVTERKDLLAGLFFVLAVWAYVEYATRTFSILRYLLAVACYVLGLTAKPMLVTLPAVLLLLDYWPLERLRASDGDHKLRPAVRALLEKLPLAAISAMSCGVTLWAQQGSLMSIERLPLSARLAGVASAYVAYLGKFFWPFRLAAFYPIPRDGLPIWVVASACGILAGISAAVVAARRSHPYLLVGWLWYLGMLIPVIGIVQVGNQAMADRYTYLPQIGLCIALVCGGAAVAGSSVLRRRIGVALAVLLLAGLTVRGWQQTKGWHDSETLWTQALESDPENWLAHGNLGAVQARRGQIDVAMAHFRRALEIHPGYAEACYNIGVLLAGQGRTQEAAVQYETALAICPDYAQAHNNLGTVKAGRGEFDAAIAEYEKAVEINPDYELAHINLGNVLTTTGRFDAAIEQFRKALTINPDSAVARRNLNATLAQP
jgi:tetratricopeptide (TPR) repeat protein